MLLRSFPIKSNAIYSTIFQLEVQFLEQLDPFFKDITLQTVVIDNPDNPHDLSWIGETLWIDEECFSGGFPICDFARKLIDIFFLLTLLLFVMFTTII